MIGMAIAILKNPFAKWIGLFVLATVLTLGVRSYFKSMWQSELKHELEERDRENSNSIRDRARDVERLLVDEPDPRIFRD